jgi:hypothetical protein
MNDDTLADELTELVMTIPGVSTLYVPRAVRAALQATASAIIPVLDDAPRPAVAVTRDGHIIAALGIAATASATDVADTVHTAFAAHLAKIPERPAGTIKVRIVRID